MHLVPIFLTINSTYSLSQDIFSLFPYPVIQGDVCHRCEAHLFNSTFYSCETDDASGAKTIDIQTNEIKCIREKESSPEHPVAGLPTITR